MADRWTGLTFSASTRSGEGACRANLRQSPEFPTIGGVAAGRGGSVSAPRVTLRFGPRLPGAFRRPRLEGRSLESKSEA